MLQLLTFTSLVVLIGAVHDEEVITINEGRVRGSKMTSFQGREFLSFRGIPYAEPPTGPRRFKPPLPKSPWREVLNATTDGSVCPQMGLDERYFGDEDCLYLNVYAHKNASQHPVMVWIHGGSFQDGNGGFDITGPKYLMDHDIVFVSFNYRLGPLGFLSTGDSALPGNYGMKDTVEVLRWIQRNIESFGGNRHSVTVFGYSSGGASAQSLTLSPLAKNLYHRVIFESGSALHPFAYKASPINEARQVAQVIGCPSTNTSSDIANCVTTASPRQLVETLYSFPSWAVKYPEPYGLVKETQTDLLDPPFLTDSPAELIRKGKVHKVPALTGDTADESIILPLVISWNASLLEDLDERFGEIALRRVFSGNISNEVVREVKEFYFGENSARNASLQQLVKLFSDTIFNYHTYKSASAHAAATHKPVFVYLFSFVGRLSFIVAENISTTSLGVPHSDDLSYIVEREYKFPDGGPNAEEARTIKRVTKMLANFALIGNPTPHTNDLLSQNWLPLDRHGSTFRHLEINEKLTMRSGPFFPERMAFWDDIFNRRKRGEL